MIAAPCPQRKRKCETKRKDSDKKKFDPYQVDVVKCNDWTDKKSDCNSGEDSADYATDGLL